MAILTQSIPSIDITAGVANTVVDIGMMPPGTKHISIHSNFTYGSGGTTAKFYLQSSIDGGTTWFDVVALAHTTASLRRGISIALDVAGALVTATDTTLADNTKIDGIAGDRMRLKYTTVGTYATTTYKMDLEYR
jgi:hypothetical protein